MLYIMGRPKGSKSKSHAGYARRTADIKQKYGDNIFREWGKRGGNPILVNRESSESKSNTEGKANENPSSV